MKQGTDHAGGGDQLVVRQHERHQCRLDASLWVDEEHADRVVFSRASGDGAGVLKAVIVDCSTGGLGLESDIFVPRRAKLVVRTRGIDGKSDVETTVRIQRVTMLDRRPTYYLGTAYAENQEQAASKMINLAAKAAMAAAKVAGAPDPGGPRRGGEGMGRAQP